jgi:RND family efflux transporter MFP subunit
VLSRTRNQAVWKDTAAREERERALAAVRSAQTRVQRAETTARLVATETRTRVETAESNLKAAQERLAIARDATRKQELRQAELAVEQARARSEQAKIDAANARQVWERRQSLYEQDAVAREEVDQAERQYKSMETAARVAEQAVGIARQKLDLAAEGTRVEEIRIMEGRAAAAERELNLARSDLRRSEVAQGEIEVARAAERQAEADLRAAEAGLSQQQMSQDEIDNARAAIREARAQIEYHLAQLEDLTIRAPVDGVISRRLVNEGEIVSPNARLMDLAALDTVYFEALVPEQEARLLRPGAACQVSVDAVPGRRFRGAVREIINVVDKDSRMFRARIAVLGGGERLPVGASARGRIQVRSYASVVAAPRDAVHTEAGGSYAWLAVESPEGGLTARRQAVALGLMEPEFVEVRSGLQEGDRVITSGSPAIIDGTALSIP